MLASIFTAIILYEAFHVDKSQGALHWSFWGREKELWFVLGFNHLKLLGILSVMMKVHLWNLPGERKAHLCAGYCQAIIYSIMQPVNLCWVLLPLSLMSIFYLCLELTVDRGYVNFFQKVLHEITSKVQYILSYLNTEYIKH